MTVKNFLLKELACFLFGHVMSGGMELAGGAPWCVRCDKPIKPKSPRRCPHYAKGKCAIGRESHFCYTNSRDCMSCYLYRLARGEVF